MLFQNSFAPQHPQYSQVEHGAEGVIFANCTAAQVALILGDKNIGSLLVKLGEVNLVLDQNSEVLGVF